MVFGRILCVHEKYPKEAWDGLVGRSILARLEGVKILWDEGKAKADSMESRDALGLKTGKRLNTENAERSWRTRRDVEGGRARISTRNGEASSAKTSGAQNARLAVTKRWRATALQLSRVWNAGRE
jgi:hypothetical protein